MRRTTESRLIIINTNYGWAMAQHYTNLIRAMVEDGWDVVAIADYRHADERRAIEAAGAKTVSVPLDHSSTSLAKNVRYFWTLCRLYRRLRPDLTHHLATKPVIFGSFAAKVARVSGVVNTVTGLGTVFSGKRERLAGVVTLLYRAALKGHTRTIFINPDDQTEFIRRKIVAESRSTVIMSSRGIDTAAIRPDPTIPLSKRRTFLLVSRMLWSKGVREFDDAARVLREQGHEAQFLLIGGSIDQYGSKNADFVDRDWLESRLEAGGAEWLGWQGIDKVIPMMQAAAAVVLPSYYPEGVPTVLLEGAAAGAPLITTDMPGCRETVVHAKSGYLVPPGDTQELARAMQNILEDPARAIEMGRESRIFIETRFSEEKIFEKIFAEYRLAEH
jgi:glycosyltransferase involved in cell wall biosynthesis